MDRHVAGSWLQKIALLLVSVAVSNSCITQKGIYVEGSLLGYPVAAAVDHKLAAAMITNRQDSSVVKFFEEYGNIQPDNEVLASITKKYSLNVATLFFIEKLYSQEKNRRLQDYYLSVIDTLSPQHLAQQLLFLQSVYVVFIPAFNYESNIGNFSQQRELFDAAKVPYEMVNVQPWGSVEDNAEIVAKQLRKINGQHPNVIAISASKGGLETAIALGKILNPGELSSVKAWINVCGILKGSPAADYWAVPVRKWWLSCGLFFAGMRMDLSALLRSLSYEQRRQEVQELAIPGSIYTVNFIAANLHLKKDRINMAVPNDGYSPLLDEIAAGGDVVVELGPGHTLEGVDLNIRMVTLLRYVVNQLTINN
ncbi:MAG: hypothetical protein LBK18_04495 [Prevotellaceae bacterium]|jgi:hypothetical protein|nr:hypothetical protein [Prevotellaceae bacterium]